MSILKKTQPIMGFYKTLILFLAKLLYIKILQKHTNYSEILCNNYASLKIFIRSKYSYNK